MGVSISGTHVRRPGKLRVVIVGGGVAALEAALALAQLAPERVETTLIAPNDEFVYRPITALERFSYPLAHRYPLRSIALTAQATLLREELDWIDPDRHLIHTNTGKAIGYDALVLALGAHPVTRYEHAITIDDRHMDETLDSLVRDIEGGFVKSLAFVSPGRMAWPLPLYELALMSAGRAYDVGVEMSVTIATPEDSPLAIFGPTASSAVAGLLERAHVEFVSSAHVQMPKAGEIVLKPGERHLHADRVIALPELEGPIVRGIPLGDDGFIRIDPWGRVPDVDDIHAAGDATDFPIKHACVAAQQADAVAWSIATAAGAPATRERLHPMAHEMLLTASEPAYLAARLTGGSSFCLEISNASAWSPPGKIAARYLAPYLGAVDRKILEADGTLTSPGPVADRMDRTPIVGASAAG